MQCSIKSHFQTMQQKQHALQGDTIFSFGKINYNNNKQINEKRKK